MFLFGFFLVGQHFIYLTNIYGVTGILLSLILLFCLRSTVLRQVSNIQVFSGIYLSSRTTFSWSDLTWTCTGTEIFEPLSAQFQKVTIPLTCHFIWNILGTSTTLKFSPCPYFFKSFYKVIHQDWPLLISEISYFFFLQRNGSFFFYLIFLCWNSTLCLSSSPSILC
jgi:hypothetical protein